MEFDPSIFVSLALLFGIAAQFRAMDGYTFLRSLIARFERRLGALFAVALIASVFSPLILNDVVILILTPVIVKYAKQFDLDVAPLLVAEITFTNIASSLTPFGNPQNLLLWQESGVSAVEFVGGTWFPLLLSGVLAAGVLLVFRGRGVQEKESLAPAIPRLPLFYLTSVGAMIFGLDILGVSGVLSLCAAVLIGAPFTLRSPRRLAKEFDYRSLLILYLLVGAVIAAASIFQPLLLPLVAPAVEGTRAQSAVFIGLSSSFISNVPATQLVLGTVSVPRTLAPSLAVEAGLAGNITPVSSFANILALLIVKRAGIPVRKAMILQFCVGFVSFIPALI